MQEKRQENMTYRWIFAILKIEMLKTSLSAVKRIGQRYVIKGTLNWKVGSCHPIHSTTKHEHRLKMTVLNKKTFVEHRKHSKQQREILFLG